MSSPRDRSQSLWIATAAESSFGSLEGEVRADVAVVGAGVAGLTVAALLKQEGVSVCVLESDRVGMGVTGHTTAKVTSLHGLAYQGLVRTHGEHAARLYAQANEAGLAQVAEFVDKHNLDCDFRRRDAYAYTENPSALEAIEAEVSAAKRLGLPASFCEGSPLPYRIAGAVCFSNQADFHPTKFLRGLAALVDGDGSFVFENTRVLEVGQGAPHIIRSEGGKALADQLVIATNYPLLDRGGLYSLRLHSERSYALAVRSSEPLPEGMFLDAGPPTRSIRTYQSGGTEFLIVGGESHRSGESIESANHYRALERFGQERLGLESVAYRWSTQDMMPLDGLPYIGPLTPFSDRIYVATGFRKWGMTNGTAAGTLVADLILGRDNPWAELFKPSRLSLRASVVPLAVETVNRIKSYGRDRGAPALRRLASRIGPRATQAVGKDLARGEGRIEDVDGEKVAVSKDANDEVRSVSPICTHMGCTVEWNADQRTWDCPCHGSRFFQDGTILQGPAREPLAPLTVSRDQ
jgi:glycine/D-amino acid oxidase-like deaminating enzyme/nitrite reductase/ring-hydroxylating ferredoxin subunit